MQHITNVHHLPLSATIRRPYPSLNYTGRSCGIKRIESSIRFTGRIFRLSPRPPVAESFSLLNPRFQNINCYWLGVIKSSSVPNKRRNITGSWSVLYYPDEIYRTGNIYRATGIFSVYALPPQFDGLTREVRLNFPIFFKLRRLCGGPR